MAYVCSDTTPQGWIRQEQARVLHHLDSRESLLQVGREVILRPKRYACLHVLGSKHTHRKQAVVWGFRTAESRQGQRVAPCIGAQCLMGCLRATTDRLAFKSDKKGSKGQRNQWSHGPQDAEGIASHLPPPANPPNLGNKHVPVRGFYPVWLRTNLEPSPNSNTVSGPNNQLGQQFCHNTHKRRHKAQSTNNTVKITIKHLKAWLKIKETKYNSYNLHS